MIIFYQIPNDETAVRLRKIIEEDKIEHMYVNKEVAGQTIGALFAGDLTENPHQIKVCQSILQLFLMRQIPVKKKLQSYSKNSTTTTSCLVIQSMPMTV